MFSVKIIVLLAVASFAISKQQCYRMGLVFDNCDSSEVKVKVVKGSPGTRGPVGPPGINGKSFEESPGLFKNLSAMLEKKLGKIENAMEKKLGKMENKLQKCLDGHNNTNSKKQEAGGSGGNGQHLSSWIHPNMMDAATVEAKFEMFGASTWKRGRETCKDVVGKLIPAEYIDTKEKLLSFGATFRLNNYFWVGVRYWKGFYYSQNGKKINMTTFPWRHNHPVKYNSKKYNGYVMCNTWDCVNRPLSHATLLCYMPNRKKFRPPGIRKYFKENMNFNQAQKFCLKKGGRLPQYNLYNKAGLEKFYKEVKARKTTREYHAGLRAEPIGTTEDRFHFTSGMMPFLPKNQLQRTFGGAPYMDCHYVKCSKLTYLNGAKAMTLGSSKGGAKSTVCEFSSTFFD